MLQPQEEMREGGGDNGEAVVESIYLSVHVEQLYTLQSIRSLDQNPCRNIENFPKDCTDCKAKLFAVIFGGPN